MYEAEDHEFFDELYQLWSQTTEAERSYWMPEEDSGYYDAGPGNYIIWAVDHGQLGQEKQLVGSVASEADADFICGIHGTLPDLIRRLHDATDEAVRKDEQNDIAQGQLAEALLEIDDLHLKIRDLEKELDRARDYS